LLAAHGIPFTPCRHVASPAEAIAFGLEVGYPIVLKGDAPSLNHKTEHKVVRLDLRNGDEAGTAWTELHRHLNGLDPTATILAQKMITGGQEVILGAFRDPQFGAVGMFGLGGIHVQVLKDVTFRVMPITDRDAAEMVRSVRGYPLLAGVRGSRPVDTALLESMLLRVNQLVSENDWIEAIDINPFIVSAAGQPSLAVDARVRLRSA